MLSVYFMLIHQMYLIKYDSTHGLFKGQVSRNGDKLVVDGCEIAVFNEYVVFLRSRLIN